MVQIGPEPLGTPNNGPQTVKQRNDAALETPRRADADQLPHQQAEIQRGAVSLDILHFAARIPVTADCGLTHVMDTPLASRRS